MLVPAEPRCGLKHERIQRRVKGDCCLFTESASQRLGEWHGRGLTQLTPYVIYKWRVGREGQQDCGVHDCHEVLQFDIHELKVCRCQVLIIICPGKVSK